MNVNRFPSDLVVGLEDFKTCAWKAVLSDISREGYSSMWQALSSARQALEEGRQAHSKVLWLLADACSMKLIPRSTNDPFKPFFVSEKQLSAIPDSFSEDEILFISNIVCNIDNIWLKARLADLIWLKNRALGIQFALTAIDAYRSIPLDAKTWICGGRECWERAITLTRMLKGGAGDRINEMATHILAVFDATGQIDGFLALWLANLLNENGLAGKSSCAIAKHLESLAQAFDTEGDLRRARLYFEAAATWFKVSKDEAKRAQMIVCVAESWVKEAVSKISSDKSSHLVAASFYENAIQIYRTIQRSERVIHRVDERIIELHGCLKESGEKSLDEMSVISTEGIDINQIIDNARNSVRGKTSLEALKAFANLYHGPKVHELRESAIKQLQNHPLQSLFPVTVMSRDGRVIAKRPGINSIENITDEDEVVILSQMIRNYGFLVSIVAQGDIWPALEVLLQEHRLHEIDFVELSKQSPIVPRGREQFFGKALFAGYDGDFVSAIHLLVPQIEHMVRYHLKAAGVKTTNLDLNGIENEFGLSKLMDIPKVTEVFGENLSFEIKALFCDSFGPNLRNNLAHGLIEEEECHSIYVIYAWWLGLKIIFISFWNAARRDTQNIEDAVPDRHSKE